MRKIQYILFIVHICIALYLLLQMFVAEMGIGKSKKKWILYLQIVGEAGVQGPRCVAVNLFYFVSFFLANSGALTNLAFFFTGRNIHLNKTLQINNVPIEKSNFITHTLGVALNKHRKWKSITLSQSFNFNTYLQII